MSLNCFLLISQLTSSLLAKYELTTVFLANYQLTVNPIGTLLLDLNHLGRFFCLEEGDNLCTTFQSVWCLFRAKSCRLSDREK